MNKQQLKIAIFALEQIVNPIGAMQERCNQSNLRLDSSAAMSLANNADYLKRIAKKALENIQLLCD